MNPAISVIVPVYNTGVYLAPCVESILNQSFTDLELVLVDDGSTDGSSELCDRYSEKDERVKCVHKKNGGVITALEKGVDTSTGSWIAFVDHDDILPKDALSTLYKLCGDESDIIVGFSFSGDGHTKSIPMEEWRKRMVRSDAILCTRWAKLYRRYVLEGGVMSAPNSIKMGEDMMMNIKASFRSEKPVTIIDAKVYDYNRNSGSFSVHFKRYAEWCGAVYDEIKKIIPQDNVALQESLIFNGIQMAMHLVLKGDGNTCKSLKESSFLHNLRGDINSYNYSLSKIESLALKYPDTIAIRLLAKFSRILAIVRKRIRL